MKKIDTPDILKKKRKVSVESSVSTQVPDVLGRKRKPSQESSLEFLRNELQPEPHFQHM